MRRIYISCIFPFAVFTELLLCPHDYKQTRVCVPALRDASSQFGDNGRPPLIQQLLYLSCLKNKASHDTENDPHAPWMELQRWKQWPADWLRICVRRCPLADAPGNASGFVSGNASWKTGLTSSLLWLSFPTLHRQFGRVYSQFLQFHSSPEQMESPRLNCLQNRSACSHITQPRSEWHNMLLNKHHGWMTTDYFSKHSLSCWGNAEELSSSLWRSRGLILSVKHSEIIDIFK